MAAKQFIVAIELGSSHMTGIAGRKTSSGSIDVMAVATKDSRNCIRKGVIYNIDEAASLIRTLVAQLERTLKASVKQVYVGIGGMSVHSVLRTEQYQLGKARKVTQADVDNMLDATRLQDIPRYAIHDVIPQEYEIGVHSTLSPVGMQAEMIEGKFLNIVALKSLQNNIDECFAQAGVKIVDYFLMPLTEADQVLTTNEKQAGCALVNIGFGTTSVSVYKNGLLRYLMVLPLGSNNVTLDICTSQDVDWNTAEHLKQTYGKAIADTEESDEVVEVSENQKIKVSELQAIIEARTREILANVDHQLVESQYSNALRRGMVLTGQGAQLRDMRMACARYLLTNEVRLVTDTLYSASLMGAIAQGKEGCGLIENVANSTVTQGVLFAEEPHSEPMPAMQEEFRTDGPLPKDQQTSQPDPAQSGLATKTNNHSDDDGNGMSEQDILQQQYDKLIADIKLYMSRKKWGKMGKCIKQARRLNLPDTEAELDCLEEMLATKPTLAGRIQNMFDTLTRDASEI